MAKERAATTSFIPVAVDEKPQVHKPDLSYRVASVQYCVSHECHGTGAFMGSRYLGLAGVALLFSAAISVVVWGQGVQAGDGRKTLTPEASLNLRNVGDLQFSPDAVRLAFVVTEPAKGTGRLRHIWIYDAGSGVARQFTFSGKSELAPRWRPGAAATGETPIRRLAFPGELAFLSDREDGQQQIFLMSMSGGEARAVTKGKRSVKAFEWSPDGKTIAFLAPDAKTEEEEKKEKDDAKVIDKDDKHARLWILDVPTGETRALTKPNWNFDELAWLPAGNAVVVKGTDRPESDQYTERIFSVQVADGASGFSACRWRTER
jgi:dipeptidyl aminopeptidase/acylaminoacyl peptidase